MCTAREEMYSIEGGLGKSESSACSVCSSREAWRFKTVINGWCPAEATDRCVPLILGAHGGLSVKIERAEVFASGCGSALALVI
jgi:hypothetical protein